MLAVVVEADIVPGKRAAYREAIAEYMALRAQCPGAGAMIQIASGEHRELVVFFWASEEASDRAHADGLIAAAQRHFPPVLTAPQRILGYGEVTGEWRPA